MDSRYVFSISSGRALVISYQTIPCNGEIATWSASVKGKFRLSFLVWEQNTTSIYNLVGRNDFIVNSSDEMTTVMDFEPLPTDRIAVKAGQVVGLFSIVEGTEAGVTFVLVSVTANGMPQNVTYSERILDVTSINISSSSTTTVPNIRPLISATIEGKNGLS